MPVRAASKADLASMADVFAASFASDRLFNVKFPYRREHPEDYVQALEEHLWLSWYDYRTILNVSYVETETAEVQQDYHRTEEETEHLLRQRYAVGATTSIVGFAEWKREGDGWESLYGIWGRWDPRLCLRPLLAKAFDVRRLFYRRNKATAQPSSAGNRSKQPLTPWNFMRIIKPFMAEFFSAPHRRDHWALEILAVHPDHQGKGYGRELVRHGLLAAESKSTDDLKGGNVDGLPVSVVASEGKEGFYLKCGFREVVGWVSRTVDSTGAFGENPLKPHGIGGCAVLWTR